MSSEAEILFERRGAAGLVTLNRPKALNAVTHHMVRELARQLDAWAQDEAITRVVVTAAGDRAFSAGGDLRQVTAGGMQGPHEQALQFWRDEYRLNAQIKRFRKPYIALIDGIVMGGGVGVSVHGSHRVAGDRFLFAMPEVGIGFFPDVGATYFLPRLPGEIGAYCALTGERLKTADGVGTGVASHHVPSKQFPELIDGLCGTISVDAILGAFSAPAGDGPLLARRSVIDRIFAGDRVETILERLDNEAGSESADSQWARSTAVTMRTKSPTSLRIALAQMRRGRGWTFEECMQAEYRIVSRIIREPDFHEGVRAVIVDKDNNPKWRPATLAEVGDATVAAHFALLGADELVLP